MLLPVVQWQAHLADCLRLQVECKWCLQQWDLQLSEGVTSGVIWPWWLGPGLCCLSWCPLSERQVVGMVEVQSVGGQEVLV